MRKKRSPRKLKLHLAVDFDDRLEWRFFWFSNFVLPPSFHASTSDDLSGNDLTLALIIAEKINRLALEPGEHRLLPHRAAAESLLLNLQVYFPTGIAQYDRTRLHEERHIGVTNVVHSSLEIEFQAIADNREIIVVNS